MHTATGASAGRFATSARVTRVVGRDTWRRWSRQSQGPTSGVRHEYGARPTADSPDGSCGSARGCQRAIGGRPRRVGRDRQRQCHANRRRCQRTTVAGCTICTASRQPLQTRESSTHRSRSARLSRSRRGAACWRTASWWRRARISASSSARVRRLDRIVERKAMMLERIVERTLSAGAGKLNRYNQYEIFGRDTWSGPSAPMPRNTSPPASVSG